MVAAGRSHSARAVLLARAASLLIFTVGVTVMAGWLLDYPRLRYLLPVGPNVKTNAALALACAGLSNYLLLSARTQPRRARVASVLSATCLSIGALTLSQHLTGWNLGIDQFLASEPPGAVATTSPNRMGPPGSTAFTLIGLALLLIDSPRPRRRAVAHGAALLAAMIALLPLVGYAFGLTALYSIARFTGIALATALTLLVLTMAIVAGRPDSGLARPLCRDDESGTMARELFAASILLTFGVGWLLTRFYHAGYVDGGFAIPAMTLVLIAGLTALVWRTTTALGRALDQRAAISEALAETAASLREADRQKSAFLATLSHELRNPLAPIRFALHLLDGPPATADRAKQIIGRQVGHMVRLVDDLLDLTRITHNKLQLQVRAVDVPQSLRDASEAVAHEMTKAGHHLTVSAPAQLLWVRADPDRLVQVLVNLLTNAIRYTPAGGRIVLAAEADGDDVVFSVRDTGAGLDAADVGRVFDMFVQIGETRHGGLGIGLALVKGLVELHGGTVDASSAGRGHGSEFRVRLPRVLDAAELPTSERHVAPHLARTILIVDDNADAADTLRHVLAARGHAVHVAYNAADALDLARAHAPEVGLLDLGLPGMDGLALARELRSTPATSRMLLVAITGWGQEDDRRRALAAGFDAHLTKPADLSAVLSLLDASSATLERASTS